MLTPPGCGSHILLNIFIYNSSIFAQSCHCFRPFSTVQMKGLLMANLIRQRVDNAAMLSCPWFYSKTPEASTAVEII